MTTGLVKGQRLRIRKAGTGDDWCGAVVALVSGNGLSVGLLLEGMVRATGGYIGGALPLMIDYKAETLTGLTGDEYEIEVKVWKGE